MDDSVVAEAVRGSGVAEGGTNSSNGRKRTIALTTLAVIVVIAAVSVFFYLRYKANHISTDDAFIEGRIHTVASKIPGTVRSVPVGINQLVRQGEVLLEIDDADYGARLNEASSSLSADRSRLSEGAARVEVAKKQQSELGHRLQAARAGLDLQEALMVQAEMDLKRAQNLADKEVISRERFEKTRTAFDVTAAQVKAARDQVRQAESALETQQAVIYQAEAFLKSQADVIKQREAGAQAAELQKGYTKILSPSDGYVTKKSVEAGNQVQPGQPLMAIVPLDDIWITANFKETQLRKVKPGQSVDIRVDMYPGVVAKGKVESIMAGTGSAFSLFPAENATGNFVKVVQRIPVRIVIDKDASRKEVLRVGMSVEPTIIIE
ncbi:MAG: HlyD family secretion protein [Thermodesulfovibrio sp.]|nr:HlyD family secretion protein [Thermodesulfovibrio sp.]